MALARILVVLLVLSTPTAAAAQTDVLIAHCFTVFLSGGSSGPQNSTVQTNLSFPSNNLSTEAPTPCNPGPTSAIRKEMKLSVYSVTEVDAKVAALTSDIKNFSESAVNAIKNEVTGNAIKADLAAAAIAAVRQDIANDLAATLIPQIIAQLKPILKNEILIDVRASVAAEVAAQLKERK